MAARGRFITFEGGDGVGKSTQAAMLAEFLRKKGLKVVETLEPGGTPFGKRIRALFLDDEGGEVDSRTQALMLYAARRDHLTKVIFPALDAGSWVVCDRYSDSTMAYQGIAEEAGMEWIAALDALVTGGMKPDLTILLTLNHDKAAARLKQRGEDDRYDRQDGAQRAKLEAAFRSIAEKDDKRVLVLDGDAPIDRLQAQIRTEVETRFGPFEIVKGA